MDATAVPTAREPKVLDASPVISVQGLTAGYGELAAIRGVDLDVRPGEVVALIGPNGAGKTTTLRAIVGVIRPLSGEVRWKGEIVAKALHLRTRDGLAYVPEERSIFKSLTVRDNLLLGTGGVDGALEFFPELAELLPRKARLLSGGEQQMLALGRALAMRPEALVVDEISLGLAPLVVRRLLNAVRDFADRAACAVLLVEQQSRRALGVADRWCLLRQGELVAAGTPDKAAEETIDAAYLAATDSAP
jgi:branched-chain amino acid transport system ATP-binding protein